MGAWERSEIAQIAWPIFLYAMENRRQDYRHVFAPQDRLHVEISAPTLPAPISGEVVDMSVSGLGVQVKTPVSVGPAQNCRVTLFLPSLPKPVYLGTTVVHVEGKDEPRFGLRLLPLLDLQAQENREKMFWQFLLQHQWRQRREKLAKTYW